MAKKEVFVSDLSGEAIDGAAAQVTIRLTSKPRSVFVLDAKEEEVGMLLSKATERTRRGRKPKAVAAA